MSPDQPQPAAAGQYPFPVSEHPFPLNRGGRADRRKMLGVFAVLGCVLAMHCAGQLAELIDEAEADVARARQRGYEQAHEEHWRAASERRG